MDETKMKIAVVGSGISGLSAAYLLHHSHDVTVFEKNDYIGGHSRTIDIAAGSQPLAVDTGFIVYNERNYPLLTGLFRHLGVATEKSDMSFGASIAGGRMEYGSKNIFAQKMNLLKPQFWRMIADILRFNRQAEKFINADNMTLHECLDALRMGPWFRDYYLLAMGAAIWSCPTDKIMNFPASTFIRFFKNHGLLTVNAHPQWRTVTGGSRAYVQRLTEPFRHKIKTGTAIVSATRTADGVTLTTKTGEVHTFDHVIFASHANETLHIIKDPSEDEKSILGAFTYQPNTVVVHRDDSFMPRRKSAWASWVYLSDGTAGTEPAVSLTYWMNNLQNIAHDTPVFITLNPPQMPAADKTYNTHVFSHPVFDHNAIRAQSKIGDIQGKNRTHFCGAWQRYGFHEDGLMSAVSVARQLGADIPW
jgi:predicted NAD/FAD-binding protein